jgi:hypothetical protein
LFTLDISDFGIANLGTWYPLITFRIFDFLQQSLRQRKSSELRWREKGGESLACLFSQHVCQSTAADATSL